MSGRTLREVLLPAARPDEGRVARRRLLRALGARRGFVWGDEVERLDGEALAASRAGGGLPVLGGEQPLVIERGASVAVQDPLQRALEVGRKNAMRSEERQEWLVALEHVEALALASAAAEPSVRALFGGKAAAQKVWQAFDGANVGAEELEPFMADVAARRAHRALGEAQVARKTRSAILRGLQSALATKRGRCPAAWVEVFDELLAALDAAGAELMERNLFLAAHWAMRYGRWLPFEDALLSAAGGLHTALQRNEIDRGNQLSTYASPWIRQAVSRAVGDHGSPIRLPVHWQGRIGAYLQKAALPADPASETASGAEGDRTVVAYSSSSMGLDLVVDGVEPVAERLFDPTRPSPRRVSDAVDHPGDLAALRNLLELGLGSLGRRCPLSEGQWKRDARREEVLRRRFGVGFPKRATLEEIGVAQEVTRERIRQLEMQSTDRLRHRRGPDLAGLAPLFGLEPGEDPADG